MGEKCKIITYIKNINMVMLQLPYLPMLIYYTITCIKKNSEKP